MSAGYNAFDIFALKYLFSHYKRSYRKFSTKKHYNNNRQGTANSDRLYFVTTPKERIDQQIGMASKEQN